jgi:peptide/nickel transport system permease protein
MAVIGGAITTTVIVVAVFAPILAPHDYKEQTLRNALLPPSWDERGGSIYLLGTDHLGRDLLSRIIFGARTSLLVGAGAVLVAGSIGTTLGLLAGFVGGRVDDVIMRLADIQLSFSAIFLCIAIMAVIGQGLSKVVIVLGIVSWVQYARVVRGCTLSVKEEPYIEAARAIGASNWRIVTYHILPNISRPLTVITTVNAVRQILNEAALSFLGLGVQPPTPAWGSMLSEAREFFPIAWWNTVFPGLAILVTVLGINLLGRRLQPR